MRVETLSMQYFIWVSAISWGEEMVLPSKLKEVGVLGLDQPSISLVSLKGVFGVGLHVEGVEEVLLVFFPVRLDQLAASVTEASVGGPVLFRFGEGGCVSGDVSGLHEVLVDS